jgi:hypothetical protein
MSSDSLPIERQVLNLASAILLEGEQRGWSSLRCSEEIAKSVTENFELLPHAEVGDRSE